MPILADRITPLLEVFDMRRSVEFYREKLGFEIVEQWAPQGHLYWAMLKLGGAVLMLNAKYEDDERPPGPDATANATHADTELFFSCGDVQSAYSHLRASGCEVKEPTTTHYGMRQVWLKDPDGFQLCFQQPVEAK
jgi:glyoxylase I family protein